MQRTHDAFKDKDVVVLTISIDGGGMKPVQAFLAKHQYTFPALVDMRMDVARKFGVRAVPTTFVINRQGTIVAHGFGEVPFEHPTFVQYLTSLAAAPRG